MSLSVDYEKEKWTFANYKLAIAKSICQQLNNNNKGIYLQRQNPELLQLWTFNNFEGVQVRVGQSVFRKLAEQSLDG